MSLTDGLLDRPDDIPKGIGDGQCVCTATLGDVRLAATTTFEGCGGGSHKVTRFEPAISGPVADRRHDDRLVIGQARDGHNSGTALDLVSDVENKLSKLVGGGGLGQVSRNHGNAVNVYGSGGKLTGQLPDPSGTELLDLLFSVA